jgi:hypothetical protein
MIVVLSNTAPRRRGPMQSAHRTISARLSMVISTHLRLSGHGRLRRLPAAGRKRLKASRSPDAHYCRRPNPTGLSLSRWLTNASGAGRPRISRPRLRRNADFGAVQPAHTSWPCHVQGWTDWMRHALVYLISPNRHCDELVMNHWSRQPVSGFLRTDLRQETPSDPARI